MIRGELPLRVIADGPLPPAIIESLAGKVELLPWTETTEGRRELVAAIYTYGHPHVDGSMLDRLPGLKVISNYGVGVDHIDLAAAAARGIPVGNTPGVLDGATADMAFTLLLAAGRRLAEGDRYARSPAFTVYDPGYMLGHEVHGNTLGIVGLGRIGRQIARRAAGFDMTVLYHNRRRREEVERELGVRYAALDELLAAADYVVLSVPLSAETRGLIGETALRKMKPTATLINVARGPHAGTSREMDLRRRARRHRPGAVAERSSAAVARQCDHRPAPGERHDADATEDGRDFDRQPAGRVGGSAAVARGARGEVTVGQ